MTDKFVSKIFQCLSTLAAVLILCGVPAAFAESTKEPEPPGVEVKAKGKPTKSCSETTDRKLRLTCEISACVVERCKNAPAIQRSPTCQETQRSICQTEVRARFK
jgi:hypothetical protein